MGAESKRLRILVVAPSVPFPVWGFGTRVYQLLRCLSASHDVTLLSYGGRDDASAVRALREFCFKVETVEAGNRDRRKRWAQLASLGSLQPYHYASLRSPAMQAAIDRLLTTQRFDVVQVESSQMSGFSFPGEALLVLDEHNVEYELLARIYRAETSALRRSYNWLEYRKCRRAETRAWRRFSACLLTSAREEALVREAGGPLTAVIPNGVDVDYFRPVPGPLDPNGIVFTGQIHYRPNTDAVTHFVRDVFPLILRQRPAANFTAVGHRAPAEVQRLAGPNVVVTGWVNDVRPHLAQAAVVAVPLRMGGGTRLKVLEALAMGKAVVTTSVGCEGLEVRHGEHLLVADAPKAFAGAVVYLLDHPEVARDLGARGRQLAERSYAWASSAARLEAFYYDLIGRRAQQGVAAA